MSLTINTNYSAVRAGFNLARNSNSLQDSINRLSSGQRINRPSDDSDSGRRLPLLFECGVWNFRFDCYLRSISTTSEDELA